MSNSKYLWLQSLKELERFASRVLFIPQLHYWIGYSSFRFCWSMNLFGLHSLALYHIIPSSWSHQQYKAVVFHWSTPVSGSWSYVGRRCSVSISHFPQVTNTPYLALADHTVTKPSFGLMFVPLFIYAIFNICPSNIYVWFVYCLALLTISILEGGTLYEVFIVI